MNPKEMRVLLIGHDPVDERVVRDTLARAQKGTFTVECATRLSEGLECLQGNGIAAIILDLNLPDSQGLASFKHIWRAAPHIPILIIVWPIDEDIAKQAIKLGAQDYLLKPHLNNSTLPKTLRRMIERKAADEALFFEQQRAEVTLNSIGDAVICVDVAGCVTYLNVVAERMTGWSRQNALRKPLEAVFHIVDGATRDRVPNPLEVAIRLDDTVGLAPNCLLIRPDGFETPIEDSASPIRDRGGQVIGAVVVFHDVSAARALAIQATHVAQHDFLTQLPNRLLLHDRLTQAIALATRHGHRLAVLFLDLDRFKHVNDSLGHVIGDGLLQSVARRLLTCVRSSDTVSRQGGDEFVVLLSEIAHADDASTSAQKIITALIEPHDVAHHHLHVTTTIGMSVCPDDGTDAETLIACADTAMYHAKEDGRNTYRFFERDMNARAVERQSIEAGLHHALARREFELHYQPKVDLETGALTGAEALIRWGHPERGLMLPKDFVPIAEDSGLILPIGQWVLREACRQARAWIDEGRPPMAVAVNVSVAEFRDARFVEHVRSVLRENGLDARYLELELTERSLMQRADATALALRALKDMGVRVAIDDFGTGQSSLSCLRQFPINGLKVDQSFVHEISSDPVGTSIVCAVISMGRSLGHRVVAEGVETREQLAFLQAQHCGEGQGYYFSRPLVADQFARLPEAGLPKRVQQ
jgi:diguanylate cyclase (GGDEF)-like protein/PAS domain S-box-containing protein